MCGLRRGRVEHERRTGPHGTQGTAGSRGLLILGGVRALSIAGGREVHEGNGGALAIAVLPGRLMVRRRHVGGTTGYVLLRGRLQLRLRGCRFLASSGLSVDIVDGRLLRDEIWVRRGHGRHGLLARALAVDLALPQPVLLQEELVVTVVPPAPAGTPAKTPTQLYEHL
jgi:hypothetical protein